MIRFDYVSRWILLVSLTSLVFHVIRGGCIPGCATELRLRIEEATKVDAVADGRVAATPAEAAESEYVDDMVSTDTQELDWDY